MPSGGKHYGLMIQKLNYLSTWPGRYGVSEVKHFKPKETLLRVKHGRCSPMLWDGSFAKGTSHPICIYLKMSGVTCRDVLDGNLKLSILGFKHGNYYS